MSRERIIRLLKQLLAFGAVGGVGFVLDVTVFTVLRETLLSPAHVHGGAIIAKTISTTIAIAANWVGNRYWTFNGDRRSNSAVEAIEFAAVSVLGMLVGLACLGVSHYVLGLRERARRQHLLERRRPDPRLGGPLRALQVVGLLPPPAPQRGPHEAAPFTRPIPTLERRSRHLRRRERWRGGARGGRRSPPLVRRPAAPDPHRDRRRLPRRLRRPAEPAAARGRPARHRRLRRRRLLLGRGPAAARPPAVPRLPLRPAAGHRRAPHPVRRARPPRSATRRRSSRCGSRSSCSAA